MIKNITNLGDAALYCDFGDKVNKEINSNVINCFKNLQNAKIKGITKSNLFGWHSQDFDLKNEQTKYFINSIS